VVPTARLIKVCGGEGKKVLMDAPGSALRVCVDKEALSRKKIFTESIINAFGLPDKRPLKIYLLSW
jgi:hypothetical protein